MFLLKTEEQTKRDPVLAAICFFCTTGLVQNTPPALLSSAWCCVSSTPFPLLQIWTFPPSSPSQVSTAAELFPSARLDPRSPLRISKK